MADMDATLACDIVAALQRAKDNADTQLDQEVLDELHQAIKAAMVDASKVDVHDPILPMSSVVLTISAKHEDD